MCTQFIEASNIANIYPDLNILYITGGKKCYKSKFKDRRPEIKFSFCFEVLGKHLGDKS